MMYYIMSSFRKIGHMPCQKYRLHVVAFFARDLPRMAIDLSLRSDCSKRFEQLQPPLVLKLRRYCVFLEVWVENVRLQLPENIFRLIYCKWGVRSIWISIGSFITLHFNLHPELFGMSDQCWESPISWIYLSLHFKSVLTLYRECTGTSKIISGFDHWGACGKCPSSEKSKKAGKPLRIFQVA